ncbi:MAG: asparagine synthase (glutamine-hydrolyzing) [Rhizobiales bacterium]|nr:asparagine synthase (glutamine-hydrolyzing) [Hyphomicrobiales bacterium]
MCGIAGLIDLSGRMDGDALARAGAAMGERLSHRGPDESGVWLDADAGLVLAHRRLSIVDLSPAGSQPMLSESGASAIAYNGEIYNADELTAGLGAGAPRLRGHSDTEPLLEACERHGPLEAARRSIGMFAYAYWHRGRRELTLVRDRLGIKPLYWWHEPGRRLAFASELGALRAIASGLPPIDREAMALYMRFAYVPAPYTIHLGIRQLRPGEALTFGRDGGAPRLERFWRLEDVASEALANPLTGSEDEVIEAGEALIADAVRRRMVADVPLGALLSGGIDSSTVVALMQRAADRPVRTFSIGFEAAGFDEAPHARAVASHLGTDHTELYVSASDAQAVIPDLPVIYDQPFADSSQIPTFLVSRLARRHVTVALSGDGGDEVFAGYNRHVQAEGLMARAGRLPSPVRRAGAAGLRALSPASWDRALGALPARMLPVRPGEKLHKVADLLDSAPGEHYRRHVSHWPDPGILLADVEEPVTAELGPIPDPLAASLPGALGEMQYRDTVGYLPGDVLAKVDRASMAVALEVRVPLIDHRVVAFGWRLPASMKVRDGRGKWLLRRILRRHLPESLFERPKMGFGVPIDGWLRGPLRAWGADHLTSARLAALGLEQGPIEKAWREHQSGRADHQHRLWTVLMLVAWHERARSADHVVREDRSPALS